MELQDILVLLGILLTFIVSLADVVLNTFVASKQRHINLSCSKCCEFDYQSDNTDHPQPLESIPQKILNTSGVRKRNSPRLNVSTELTNK